MREKSFICGRGGRGVRGGVRTNITNKCHRKIIERRGGGEGGKRVGYMPHEHVNREGTRAEEKIDPGRSEAGNLRGQLEGFRAMPTVVWGRD